MPLDGFNYQPCKDAAILRKAANLIRIHGHTKADLGSPERGFCVHGAINYALRKDVIGHDGGLGVILANYLISQGIREGVTPGVAVLWNNKEERTKEEVIEALEGAAKFAEEKAMETV